MSVENRALPEKQPDSVSRRFGPITGRAGCIIANALEVAIRNGVLECVVESNASPDQLPTQHDRRHAAIVSLVFSQQDRFSRFQCSTAVLRYACGTHRRIRVDIGKTMANLERVLAAEKDADRPPIPAPVVSFLLSRRVVGKDFRLS